MYFFPSLQEATMVFIPIISLNTQLTQLKEYI